MTPSTSFPGARSMRSGACLFFVFPALVACAANGEGAAGAGADLTDCVPTDVEGGLDLDCDGVPEVFVDLSFDFDSDIDVEISVDETTDEGDGASPGSSTGASAGASAGPGFASAGFYGFASGSGSSSVSGSASAYVGPGGRSGASSSGSSSSGGSASSDSASAGTPPPGGGSSSGGAGGSASTSTSSTSTSTSTFSCSRSHSRFGGRARVNCADGAGGIECVCIDDGVTVGSCTERFRGLACSYFGCCNAFF